MKRHLKQHVGARPSLLQPVIGDDAAGERAGLKPEQGECIKQQQVQFVAVAAAPLYNEFTEDAAAINRYGLAQDGAQGLKWQCRHVPGEQGFQCGKVAPGGLKPYQVKVLTELCGVHGMSSTRSKL